jgi:hypothetical protein
MDPPPVGFLFREDARGDSPSNMSPQKELEKIVGSTDGPEGERDIGHSDFGEEARKTPANPTVLHRIAKGECDFARGVLERRVAELALPVKVMRPPGLSTHAISAVPLTGQEYA